MGFVTRVSEEVQDEAQGLENPEVVAGGQGWPVDLSAPFS